MALWLARICSTSVVPDRGKPTMKMGCGTWARKEADGPADLENAASRFACFATSLAS